MSWLYRLARRMGKTISPDTSLGRTLRPLGERMLRWTTGNRGLEWAINGVPCRIDPRFRARMPREYEPDVARYLSGKILPGQTCFDVGANTGAWVIQFAHAVGPTGRVVAFEPNLGARLVLQEHIRLNNMEPFVQVVPAAVGASPGEVNLFAADYDGRSRLGEPNPMLAGKTSVSSVPVVKLDQWCQQSAVFPDWLFIDIEGFEGHALTGAAELIRTRGKELYIIVEMHPTLWAASGTTRDEVAGSIAAVGRRPVALSGQKDPLAEYGHVVLEPTDS